MKHDKSVALVIVVISLFYLIGANAIPQAGSNATVGPRAFPIGIGILMLLSGVWLFVSAYRAQRNSKTLAEIESIDWKRWGMAVGILVLYAVLEPILGFLVVTPLLMFGESWVFGSRNWKRDALIAIVISAVVYTVFNYALNMKLA